MRNVVHLNLDDAWIGGAPDLPLVEAREWGPHLRFSAPARRIEQFYCVISPQLQQFVLYGSGDFHHLSALWLRRAADRIVVVSFDNHPDWDVRPPRWTCGGWVNRALELPQVEKVAVWGCGNSECWWPRRLFGNRRAERAGKLEVHPWADERSPNEQQRRGAIFREDWREQFSEFARGLGDRALYVTIDIDCLRGEEAVTNWENGRFTLADLTWALGELRQRSNVVAGDVCGAYSPPRYARWRQRFASEFDHPKLLLPNEQAAREINRATVKAVITALAG